MLGGRPGPNSLDANGAPWAICITPPNAAGTQYLYSSDAVPGRVYKLTLEGKVLGDAGKKVGEFGWIHQIACPTENELWVGEILNWRVQTLEAPADEGSAIVHRTTDRPRRRLVSRPVAI